MTGNDRPEDAAPRDSWHTYRMDPDDRPTDSVVRAVAAVRNAPILELERLYDTIDPDALDTLLTQANPEGEDVRVRFTYANCIVEATTDIVRVREDTQTGLPSVFLLYVPVG